MNMVEDLVIRYQGQSNASRLEGALSGSMSDLISSGILIVIFKDIKIIIPLSFALQLVYNQKR
ncbi:MAG: hypothetical protein DID90_2727553705 [Candidatus Nitrotoga sp. LAW]|nr:MAG: hypothetical protein DID90_2727553705 [Candidatus Nitrotoga sp. LAW]